jgi:hypothetical protein
MSEQVINNINTKKSDDITSKKKFQFVLLNIVYVMRKKKK